ncbi:hypothetical protein K1T71_006221 [Dendrolimus kikuchii]|uniref:Uncharacterized protein n=1 Tax=Dendrolimus kikuchii TaxID=765133 RepID=A0ACC1D3C3_9NEOP|nr:hypothetical protein K1T71_006221 [Dendrolimus kikuchii]
MDEVIVGTYEGFLLGYSLRTEETDQKLRQTFASHLHTASVRCASMGGKFLASGGTDDRVVVVDMKTRKEHTVLMNHDGTINSVAFTHGGTHLLSASDDGSIIVTRTGNWQMEKIWKKAHGGHPVTAIAVHPSDKLALSIGGDKSLRTWNLIKGRPAFTINLASKGVVMATDIKFSPSGDRFSLVSQQTVDVWTISKAGLEKRITCNSKPTCVQWVSDDKMFVGLENGNIINFSMSDTQANTFQAHKERVKCLHYENDVLYSASSVGEIKLWSTINKLNVICSCNASCRITCMTLNRQNHLVKKEEQSDEENEKTDNDIGNSDIEHNSDDANNEPTSPLPKRKSGAFVTVSYGGDDNDGNDKYLIEPPAKKTKKRKRSKRAKKINKSN